MLKLLTRQNLIRIVLFQQGPRGPLGLKGDKVSTKPSKKDISEILKKIDKNKLIVIYCLKLTLFIYDVNILHGNKWDV